jgi:succinate-acetate transporter protein
MTSPASSSSSTAAPAPAITIADPGPLGLAAFALTTFVLSVFNAGLLGLKAEPVVFGLALSFGGIVQIIAGVIEFFKNNQFGGVAFCSYGAFWMSFWYLSTHPDFFAPDAPKAQGVGIFLLGWTIFTAYMTVAASKVTGGLFATFVVLLGAFIALTVGDLSELTVATRIGGWLGLGAAILAWYNSAAGVINTTHGKVVLPVWPRGAGH